MLILAAYHELTQFLIWLMPKARVNKFNIFLQSFPYEFILLY